jgi:hypothetical protein
MEAHAPSTTELAAMLATLCVYEERFGPGSIHTLRLAIVVAEEFRRLGAMARSRRILEAVARESATAFGPDHDLRVDALARLRDLLLAEGDTPRATAVQRELIECRPELTSERTRFAAMVFAGTAECSKSAPQESGSQ